MIVCKKIFFLCNIWVLFLTLGVLQTLEAKSSKQSRMLVQKAKDAYLKKDYLVAKKAYQQACKMGDYLGCSGLGTLFERGHGVLQDLSKAQEYYEYACKHNDAFGCFSKEMLEKGENAVELYSKGCDEEKKNSCLALGNLYYKGMGQPKDAKSAVLYYQKACSLKSAEGCFNLGLIYQNGDGKVEQNDDMALAYFALARQYWEIECQNGGRSSCEMLNSLNQFGVLR